MTGDRTERELRDFLTGRATRPASPSLRARVQAVTTASPAHTAGWRRHLAGSLRAAVGVAAAAAVLLILVAVVPNIDRLTVRDPGRVGASPAPGLPVAPFVVAPAGVFSEPALLDARRRLDAVYAATGVEATFIVQAEASSAQVSAPEGWPGRYDRDGDPTRDITAVFGIAPDGTVLCCLTLSGDLIIEAERAGYWRPMDMPGALDADLAAATPEFRDVALDRFVRGIEDLAPTLALLDAEVVSNDTLRGIGGIIMVLGPILVLAAVALRRRAPIAARGSSAADLEVIELHAPAAPSAPTVAARPRADGDPIIEWQAPAPGRTQRRWPDQGLIGIVLAVVIGFAILAVVDLALPPATEARLDPSLERSGLAGVGPNVVPLALLAAGLGALIAYAIQGGWRRRVGVVALVVSIAWPMSLVVGEARPTLPDRDRAWVTTGDVDIQHDSMGLSESVTYRLEEGATFTFATTIHNPGVVPVTVLGLDGVAATQPNPHVASIVGIGWVVQPGADDVTTLSARPEDAAATWPVTIRPGGSLAIVLVGRAGACADAQGTAELGLVDIDLAYRVLGFERSTEIGLPAILSFASRRPCTVEVPGGTVTYGAP